MESFTSKSNIMKIEIRTKLVEVIVCDKPTIVGINGIMKRDVPEFPKCLEKAI